MTERNRELLYILGRIFLMWSMIPVARALKLHWFEAIPLFFGDYLFGFAVTSLMESWRKAGIYALQLADEAAFSDDLKDGRVVQVVQGFSRRLPPRHVYACAVATPGQPIEMYRGVKIWSIKPLLDSESSRSGMLCWKYRP
jgi:hypothetical protein